MMIQLSHLPVRWLERWVSWRQILISGTFEGGCNRALGVKGRMGITQTDAIEVKEIKGKGRGVFARRAIRNGEVIERVPVIVLPLSDITTPTGPTRTAGYCFEWSGGKVAMALGYGSLYNHSFRPNARYDPRSRQINVFRAIRDIAAGEEILINYNGEPDDLTPVWFEVLEPEPVTKLPESSVVPSRNGNDVDAQRSGENHRSPKTDRRPKRLRRA
jgi:SET domain-containing protein